MKQTPPLQPGWPSSAPQQQQQQGAPAGPDPRWREYEYMVLSLREGFWRNRFDTGKLQNTLNHYAAQGWRLGSVNSVAEAGHLSNRGEQILVLERRVQHPGQ